MRPAPLLGSALCVLVVLAPLLAGVGQAQGEAVDLAVVSVRVPDLPSRADGVATDSVVEVTVRNEGVGPASGYQLHYRWVDAQGARPLNGGPVDGRETSVDVREESLQPGKQATFTFTWTLQPDQVGPGTVRVTVQPAGAPDQATVDTDPSDNEGSVGVFVAEHATRAVALGEPQEVPPDGVVFVRFEVRNDGNVDEPVHLSLAPPSNSTLERVDLELDATDLVVPTDGTRTATLYVSYPYRGDPSQFTIHPTVVFESGYGRVEHVMTPAISSSVEPTDPDAFGASLRAPVGSAFGTADEPVEAVLVATNTGSADDSYRVSAEAPGGWSVEVRPERLALAPGESGQVTLVATPAHSLGRGSNATVRVVLSPESLSPDTVAEVDVRVRGPSPRLGTLDASPDVAYAGDEVTLAVDLHNLGDDALPAGSSLVFRFNSEGEPDRVERVDLPRIGPGATLRQAAAAGSFAGGRVGYAVEWSGPGFVQADDGTLDVHAPKITITPPTPQQGMPGERVSYRLPPYAFMVRNDGTHAETFRLLLDGAGGAASLLGEGEVNLRPGESDIIPFEVTLPKPAGRTERVDALLRVQVAQRATLQWSASVATIVEDLIAPSVSVDVRPGAWQRSLPMEVAAEVADDGRVQAVDLLTTDPSGGNRTLSMRQDEGGTWRASVLFDADGEHTLAVRATDGAGNQATLRAWTVDVQPTPTPRIELPPLAAPWPAGSLFPVEVDSERAVEFLQYTLLQEDQTVASGEVSLAGGRAEVVLAGTPGNATLRLSAVDGAGGRAAVDVDLFLTETETTDDSPSPVALSTPGPGVVWLAVAAVVVALRRGRSA